MVRIVLRIDLLHNPVHITDINFTVISSVCLKEVYETRFQVGVDFKEVGSQFHW